MIGDPDARPGVPRTLGTAAALSSRFLLVAAAAVVLGYVAVRLRLVLVPVVVALLLATVLAPPARWLRGHGWPRTGAALTVLAASLAALGLLVWALAPPVANETAELDLRVGAGIEKVEGWLTDGPLALSEERVGRFVDRAKEELASSRGAVVGGVVSGAVTVVEIAAGLLLSVFLLFFFVKDGDRLWSSLVELFPESRRGTARELGDRAWGTLGGYMRGTAIVALVDAVFIGLALFLLGVPLVVPLAVLTFFGGFFPLVGATVAGAVAALVALVSNGFVTALLVVGAILLVQQLEGNVFQPFVLGRAVRLHPVAVVLAVTAGAILWGILGAFLAVPLAAVVRDAGEYLRGRSKIETELPREIPLAMPASGKARDA